MITIKNGDLIKGFRNKEVAAIAHVCNCQGKMNSGVAKAIRASFPQAYDVYMKAYYRGSLTLGTYSAARISEVGGCVINLHAQEFYGYDGKRYLNYEALYNACEEISIDLGEQVSIGVPYLMGCDRAGGSWKIVSAILEETFCKRNIEVIAYKL